MDSRAAAEPLNPELVRVPISDTNNQDLPANTSRWLYDLLRKTGLKGGEVYELVQFMQSMASENLVTRLESKIDAQNTKYNVLIWMIGFATAILSAVILFTRAG